MIEVDLQIYVTALFTLMFTSIIAFLIIIRKINSNQIPVKALSFYKIYFILGLVGWLGLWVKDTAYFDFELSMSVIFYVLDSLFLLLAIAECNRRQRYMLVVGAAHLLIALFSLLIINDVDRIIFVAVYTLAVYPFIFWISLKSALQRNNIGPGLISFAALSMLGISLVQLYYTIFVGDVNFAYGLSVIASATCFVLVGIGFLSSVLINEHQMLAKLALHDPLTGLLNRRGLVASVNTALGIGKRQNRCFSAITTDIDYFKRVNDGYGHEGGDYVLKQFAKVLSEMSRESDVCCRLGGEEFVLLLPETTSDIAQVIAERIRACIEKLNINYETHTIPLTSSFGVATHCNDIDLDYLIKDADKALYQAKSDGRNRVCVAVG